MHDARDHEQTTQESDEVTGGVANLHETDQDQRQGDVLREVRLRPDSPRELRVAAVQKPDLPSKSQIFQWNRRMPTRMLSGMRNRPRVTATIEMMGSSKVTAATS